MSGGGAGRGTWTEAAAAVWRDVVYIATRYSADGCGFMAAAIAFYAFFAFFPFTLAIITLLAHLVEPAAIQHHIVDAVEFYLPTIAGLVEENIRRMLAVRTRVGIAALLALYWASSGVFTALQTALNRVWDIPPQRSIILRKAQDLAVGGFLALLVCLSVVGHTALKAAQIVADSPLATVNGGWLGLVVPFLVTVVLFSLAYRFIPNTCPSPKTVIAGGLVGALWAESVRVLLTWYVGSLSPYALVYGSLGVVIALLFWIYLTAAGFLLGAQVAALADSRERAAAGTALNSPASRD